MKFFMRIFANSYMNRDRNVVTFPCIIFVIIGIPPRWTPPSILPNFLEIIIKLKSKKWNSKAFLPYRKKKRKCLFFLYSWQYKTKKTCWWERGLLNNGWPFVAKCSLRQNISRCEIKGSWFCIYLHKINLVYGFQTCGLCYR